MATLAVKVAPLIYFGMTALAIGADNNTEVINPTTASYTLIAGFTAMLGLQAWIIKFLLTTHKEALDKLGDALNKLGEQIATLRESNTDHAKKTTKA